MWFSFYTAGGIACLIEKGDVEPQKETPASGYTTSRKRARKGKGKGEEKKRKPAEGDQRGTWGTYGVLLAWRRGKVFR
jgi:hypothetical protein